MFTRIASILTLLLATVGSTYAAELLPDVENVRVEGNTLIWDSLAEADGYNVYRDYQYLDSVMGSSSYELSQAGHYDVVAFDDAGNFGTQFEHHVQFVPVTDADVSIVMEYYTAIVQKTCGDVMAGDSCIATCPVSLEQYGSIVYTKYLSGGACSTSGAVNADASVTDRTYKCTANEFAETITAQGVCVIRSR